MEVDNPTQKLNFDGYNTPTKKRKSPQASSNNLEVFLRLRPRNKATVSTATYQISNEQQSISLTSPNQSDIRNYSFNHIFDEQTINSQVFDKLGQVAITRFLSGYSNLIFSYGITGSGKTHTIMGSSIPSDGLIPSILSGLFNHSLIKNNHSQYNIFASYLENYTKDIYDLLLSQDNPHNSKGLTIRALPSGADIPDLTTIQITDSTQALQLIEFGNLKRSKAHTKLNTNSSRSHALFMLDLFGADGTLKSQMCIVDLAGSESVKRTGFDPGDVRFNESCEINTSLSALGRCIESIQSGRSAIPWREVVLTKILYQYLTGHGYVSMIVNAHITNDDYNETMRAMEFASNSQKITMNPVVNSTRASSRHKKRIFARNNDNEHIHYINSLSNIEMLRKIAVEAYKTALKTRQTVMCLKNKKLKKIDMFFKLKQDGNKIQSIQEEEDIDIDDKAEQKYKILSQQMAQKEMEFEEKIAEINHLYSEIKRRDVQIENFKENERVLLDKMNSYKRSEQKMGQLSHTNHDFKENERVLLDKINSYKSSMNGSEQKMEKLTHSNRDLKAKLQGFHIEITESKERTRKLMDIMDKLKVEYKDKCDEFNRNIGVYEKINKDLERELLAANKCRLDRDVKYKQLVDEIKTKDSHIDGLNRCNMEVANELNAKMDEIEALNRYKGDYFDKDNAFKQLIKEIEDKNEEIVKLNGCKIQRENEINLYNLERNVEIEAMINAKNEEIDRLNECQIERDNQYKLDMEEKDAEIQRKIDEIYQETASNLLMKMNAKNEEIEAQNVQIDAKHTEEIREKMDLIHRQNDEINAKKVEINEKTAEINNKNEEIINLENMLESENNKKNDEKLEREKEIKSKNELIITAENMLKQEKITNDTLIKQLNTKNNERINHKNEQILKLKTLLANEKNINDQNNEKNKQILKLENMLKQKKVRNNKLLNEKNQEINNKHEQIVKLENRFTENEEKRKEILTEINTKNAEIINLQNMLNKLINEKETENKQKNQQLNYQNEEIVRLQNEKIKMQNEAEKEINFKNEQIINLENILNQNKFTNNQEINKLNNEIAAINLKLNAVNTDKNESFNKYETLQIEYTSQCNKLLHFKTIIKKMNNELAVNKNNLIQELQTMENDIYTEFSAAITTKLDSTNGIISEWKRKWSQIDMQNHALNGELYALQSKYTQKCEFHTISLREADEEYIKQQNEISEWKKLTVELESKNKLLINKNEHENYEKDDLQKQLKSLQEQLTLLRIRSLPQSANKSNKSSRKRQRSDMEQSGHKNHAVTHPNKKRKLTDNIIFAVDEDSETVLVDTNINQPDSNSLEPRHLLNDLMPETPLKEAKKSSIPISKSKLNRNLFSPALSHLSEGDEPLPKKCKLSVRKKERKKRKKFQLMRTPATKQSKSKSMKSRLQIPPTPITKTGLRQLRCVDLKAKLKKHDLKMYGKKETLVTTLFNHKNKSKTVNDEEQSSIGTGSDEEDIDYNWIGSPIREMNGNKYYGGIIVSNVKYLIGGECFVATDAEESEDDAWMSQIVELFEDEGGDVFMGNMWYWKYDEIKKAIKRNREHRHEANEVFMSDGHAPDINHMALIITSKRFKVFGSKKEMEHYGGRNKENNMEVFFSEYYYNQKKKQLIHRSEHDMEEKEKKENDKKARTKNRRKNRS